MTITDNFKQSVSIRVTTELAEPPRLTPCRSECGAFSKSGTHSVLAFTVVEHDDLRVVSVGGEIDGTNADAFELACSDPNGKRTIVDMLTCPYIDSTGLTALIKASHRNTLTVVLQPTSRIYRIFAITQLLSYFTIASTLGEATADSSVPARVAAPLAGSESSRSFA